MRVLDEAEAIVRRELARQEERERMSAATTSLSTEPDLSLKRLIESMEKPAEVFATVFDAMRRLSEVFVKSKLEERGLAPEAMDLVGSDCFGDEFRREWQTLRYRGWLEAVNGADGQKGFRFSPNDYYLTRTY